MTRSSSPARPGRPVRGFTLVEILVVITIIAALMGMVAAVIPRSIAAKNRLVCQTNLQNIGGVLMEPSAGGSGPRARGKPGMLLQAYALGLIRKGDERVFLCPLDIARRGQNPDDPAFLRRYGKIDLEHPDPEICSYLVRDTARFPWRPDSDRKEAIAICPWHSDGVTVLYDDGTARFLDREALGIPAGDPIVVGPGSPVELLRMFPSR